jgi:hypothetical protein
MTHLTVDQIAEKHSKGETLSALEMAFYRLNFRPDGTPYSADPVERAAQMDIDIAATMAKRKSR